MKRLWIRAHALNEVEILARRNRLPVEFRVIAADTDPNSMVVVEVDDALAEAVARSNFLRASGKVLAENESPPYVGSDPPLSEEELRTEFAK